MSAINILIENLSDFSIDVIVAPPGSFAFNDYIIASRTVAASIYEDYGSLEGLIPQLPAVQSITTVSDFLGILINIAAFIPISPSDSIEKITSNISQTIQSISVNIPQSATTSPINNHIEQALAVATVAYFASGQEVSFYVKQKSSNNQILINSKPDQNWVVTNLGVFTKEDYENAAESSDILYQEYPQFCWFGAAPSFGKIEHLGNTASSAVGKNPAVAITDDQTLVESHKSHDDSTLYYSIGKMDTTKETNWGESIPFGTGNAPCLTVGQSAGKYYAVNVHSSHRSDDHTLYYNVGIFNLGRSELNPILWNYGGQHYTSGAEPSIAAHENQFVEVHKSHDGNELYYNVGTVNPDFSTLSFSPHFTKFDTGKYPSISLYGNICVQVCIDSSGTDLYSRVGMISGTTIVWGEPSLYDTGSPPKIALYSYGKKCIAIHRGSGDDNNLYYRTGFVDTASRQIKWYTGSSQRVGTTGHEVAIGSNASVAVEAHKSSSSQEFSLFSQLISQNLTSGNE